VLQNTRPHKPELATEPDPLPTEADSEGRGVASPSTLASVRTGKRDKKVKGRTLYLHDDLWERMIVQAHRKDLTISDYAAFMLNKHVPNHRKSTAEASTVAYDPVDDRDYRAVGSGPSVPVADPADDQEAA
jgi:hypothetical protein